MYQNSDVTKLLTLYIDGPYIYIYIYIYNKPEGGTIYMGALF